MTKAFGRIVARLRAWARRNWVEFFAGTALLVLAVFVLWPFMVHTVPPGHVGVLWKRFSGTQIAPESIRSSGIRFTMPWDRLYIYDARLQNVERTVQAVTIEGLDVTVSVLSRFVIVPEKAGMLHEAVGEAYTDTLLEPALRAMVLSQVSKYRAENLYSEDRADFEAILLSNLRASLTNVESKIGLMGSLLTIADLRVEEITLPEIVRDSIHRKEQMRQISETFDYRLELEDKERERKRIEAEGIRAFQNIVSPGVTESYLRWRGIEATLELAQSPNTKIIVIGGGTDGLPIILNADPQTAPSEPASATQTVDTPTPSGADIEASSLDQIQGLALDNVTPETTGEDMLRDMQLLALPEASASVPPASR
jgi:prohibitin 2